MIFNQLTASQNEKRVIDLDHEREVDNNRLDVDMEALGLDTGKVDWVDWDFVLQEASRQGLGEQGAPAKLSAEDKASPEYQEKYNANGFNGLLSDKISSQRAIPDIRHPKCRDQKYLVELPSASIIIPVYNEHFSTLVRSVHSIVNRSPPELVEEILLVDDNSPRADTHDRLDKYLLEHADEFEKKVRVVRLRKRSGLIGAKQAGAKEAKGKVLIFLDSHIEANVNWLPPLLEPMALNNRTVSCPFIDVIDEETLAYRAQDEGARGSFDWRMDYKRLPRNPEDKEHPIRPFDSPVMAGGLFAIWADHFWELGGYDPGLQIWGGEQYELSFKLWMCRGGRMVDVPCSRLGHIYRKFSVFSFGNVLGSNIRRVADVWMDDYKKYIWERRPDFSRADPGNVSHQVELRNRLQCKSFKWFMENVAYDQNKHYPAVIPTPFAQGYIKSQKDPKFCVEASFTNKITIALCDESSRSQKFEFTYKKDVQIKGHSNSCWDFQGGDRQEIQQYPCHGQHGNQLFKYDDAKIIRPSSEDLCLDCDLDNKKLFMAVCDTSSRTQLWTVEKVNSEMLRTW